MDRTVALVKPLLGIATFVGLLRLLLAVLHAPRGLVYAASLTGVELAGTVYLAVQVARAADLGYRELWLANLILFGWCQLLTIGGMTYTYATGIPTLYHETERLRRFLGYDPSPAEHVIMHVMNWMVIAPAIATWVIGAPIVYVRRRLRGPGASTS
jgi:hypothetical protein